MPRKSKAAREIEPWMRPAEVVAIQPPVSLSEAAKGVWIDLVSTHEPEHFRKGDATLMQQYCEASALAAKAAAGLQTGDDSRLKVWERATSIMASLALRLRLGPQSRREKAKVGRPLTWDE